MSNIDWQRVIEVFDAAVLRGTAERTVFLDDACGSDLDLRREVESLLAHDEAASAQFLEPVRAQTVICDGSDLMRDARGVEHSAAAPPHGEPTTRNETARHKSILPEHQAAHTQQAAQSGPASGWKAMECNDDDRRIGATVAGHRLIEIIATGGMGAVYRAHQEKLKRDVAIKIVRPGLAAAGALKRLEHEARFLARLRHPHIAQVFEAGTFRDPATSVTVPYFVMELVEGAQPITTYCGAVAPVAAPGKSRSPGGGIRTPDASPGQGAAVVARTCDNPDADVHQYGDPHHARCENPGAPGSHERSMPPTRMGGSDPLSLRERLELFLQVCDAVHHGHQRGLIHRDLKPGNILVDSAGQVKIIDFGIARSTDADITLTTLQTDSGQLVGTLQYMSPEQCAADAADLDVRSDVYSLGVVLYQLMCDRLPYDLTGATIFTAARMVCEQPADPPRSINLRLPRDVEAILLKCLEKDRNRRYQSAAQLADDVRRHLVGETISARPPGAYRCMMRWVSRHAIAATAIACAAMLAITTLATAVGVYVAGLRPNKLWISDDRLELQLETIAGHRRGHLLRGDHGGYVVGLRHFVARHGKRLAIVGLRGVDTGDMNPGLYAFDADKDLVPQSVVWHRTIREETIPPPPQGRSYAPRDFGICDIMLLDIFPEVGEPQLVSIWYHDMYSWRALCIHDLDGNLLYQIWHDGDIAPEHTQWRPEARLLVVAGTYCTHRPWLISRELPEAQYAVPVVLALRPQLGQIETKLMSVPELDEWWDKSPGRDTANGLRAAAAWYKFVWPLHRKYHVGTGRLTTTSRLPSIPAGVTAFVLRSPSAEDGAEFGGFHWGIDASGDNVPDTLVISDSYVHARDVLGLPLPDPHIIRLVDLETLVADPFGDIADRAAADDTPANGSAAGRTSPERPHSADAY